MPRCPGCNKFCSVEAGEAELDVEVDDADIQSGSASVRVYGSIPIVSECCGEEVGRINIDETVKIQGEKEYEE